MSRWAAAATIWVGIDVVLGALAAPVMLTIFIPGIVRALSRHDVSYIVSILVPNVTLMIIPGAVAAGAYLVVASRVSRR